MQRIHITLLLLAGATFVCAGCIKGPDFPYYTSPRAITHTPGNPSDGNISITFQLIDREKEPGNILLEYSTNAGVTFKAATLLEPSETQNLQSEWFPGITHSVRWNSPVDMVGISGDASVIVKVTPSDATNPSGGSPGVSGTFTVNNIAYNSAPTATLPELSGVKTGNIRIDYTLTDIESDTCYIVAEYSIDGGSSWNTATRGPAGDDLSDLSSSPDGAAHMFLWNSREDDVAPTELEDDVKLRITPGDFHTGTAGEAGPFTVDNTVPNSPPTVTITSGPAEGETVYETQVTFTWEGTDTDGTVIGYYYSFDYDPPDVWTTDTSATSGVLSLGSHTFRVQAMDDQYEHSSPQSRTFTISAPPFVKTWGGSSSDYLYAVAVDSSGNIYCAGVTLSFGAGDYDPLLLKYDSSGALQWVRTWGGSSRDWLNAVAVDSSGNIYCAGYTYSFGAGGMDALLVKYNSSGTAAWAKTWGGSSPDHLRAVTVDSSGNIYCAGETGSFDALLMKYNGSGALQWAKTWGGGSWDCLYAIALDPSGDIYCAGYTRSFGVGVYNALLLKYNSSGALLWAKTWGGTNWDWLYAIALDSGGNIYCAGYTSSFGAGNSDVLLLKYNSSGALQWANTWGGSYRDELHTVALDSSGNIYCAGYTWSFGAEWEDVLLLEYDSSGALQWARTWGGIDTDSACAVVVDSTGNVCLGGYTESYTGVWQEVTTGSQSGPSGTITSPTGTTGSPSGTIGSPAGTETSPTGSEAGAGGYDTLLLKNW